MSLNPPLPVKRILPADVAIIKHLLWEGLLTQYEIAKRFDVSQPTISYILHGYAWRDILWPDGSQGAMPLSRWNEIKSKKQDHLIDPAIRDLSDQVTRRLIEKEALEDDELARKIKDVKGKRTRPKTAPKKKLLSWSRITRDTLEDCKIVEEAKGDHLLRDVVCEVFSTIPREEWSSAKTEAIVRNLVKQRRRME